MQQDWRIELKFLVCMARAHELQVKQLYLLVKEKVIHNHSIFYNGRIAQKISVIILSKNFTL